MHIKISNPYFIVQIIIFFNYVTNSIIIFIEFYKLVYYFYFTNLFIFLQIVIYFFYFVLHILLCIYFHFILQNILLMHFLFKK